VQGLLRGIFDKETRRKAVAAGGAAMELRARLRVGKAAKTLAVPSGNGCYARWALVEGSVSGSGGGWKSKIDSLFSR
jgi:hypothetical protein